MPGRYSPDRYKKQLAGVSPKPLAAGVEPSARTSSDADMWRFIGDIAPAAGTALGTGAGALIGGLTAGVPTAGVAAPLGIAGGAAVGGGIGSAIGNMVGAGAKGHSADLLAPTEDENAKRDEENQRKEARRSEMLSILTSLRR